MSNLIIGDNRLVAGRILIGGFEAPPGPVGWNNFVGDFTPIYNVTPDNPPSDGGINTFYSNAILPLSEDPTYVIYAYEGPGPFAANARVVTIKIDEAGSPVIGIVSGSRLNFGSQMDPYTDNMKIERINKTDFALIATPNFGNQDDARMALFRYVGSPAVIGAPHQPIQEPGAPSYTFDTNNLSGFTEARFAIVNEGKHIVVFYQIDAASPPVIRIIVFDVYKMPAGFGGSPAVMEKIVDKEQLVPAVNANNRFMSGLEDNNPLVLNQSATEGSQVVFVYGQIDNAPPYDPNYQMLVANIGINPSGTVNFKNIAKVSDVLRNTQGGIALLNESGSPTIYDIGVLYPSASDSGYLTASIRIPKGQGGSPLTITETLYPTTGSPIPARQFTDSNLNLDTLAITASTTFANQMVAFFFPYGATAVLGDNFTVLDLDPVSLNLQPTTKFSPNITGSASTPSVTTRRFYDSGSNTNLLMERFKAVEYAPGKMLVVGTFKDDPSDTNEDLRGGMTLLTLPGY